MRHASQAPYSSRRITRRSSCKVARAVVPFARSHRVLSRRICLAALSFAQALPPSWHQNPVGGGGKEPCASGAPFSFRFNRLLRQQGLVTHRRARNGWIIILEAALLPYEATAAHDPPACRQHLRGRSSGGEEASFAVTGPRNPAPQRALRSGILLRTARLGP